MENHLRHTGPSPWSRGRPVPQYQSSCPPWPVLQYQAPPLHWNPIMVRAPPPYPQPIPPPYSQPMSPPYPHLMSSPSPPSMPPSYPHHMPTSRSPKPMQPPSPQTTPPPYPQLMPPQSPQPMQPLSPRPMPSPTPQPMFSASPQPRPPHPLNLDSPPFTPRGPARVRLVNPCVPLYYVTFPAPYYVTLHGGIMLERPAPIHRPRPDCGNRKRAMSADSDTPDGGVAPAPMQRQQKEMPGEGKIPKKNKLENNVNVEQQSVAVTGNVLPPKESFRHGFAILAKEKKEMTAVRISAQDCLEPHTSTSAQPASSTTVGEQCYVAVLNSNESLTMRKSVEKVNIPKTQFNNDLIPLPSTSSVTNSPIPERPKAVVTELDGVEKQSSENLNHLKLVFGQLQDGSKQLKGDLDNLLEIKSRLSINSIEAPRKGSMLLEIAPNQLYNMLKNYVPTNEQLKNLGYPFTLAENPRVTLIYKQEIRTCSPLKNNHRDKKRPFESSEKICVRCGESFYVKGFTYLTMETCQYHWGKIVTTENYKMLRACCNGDLESDGCTTGKLHVWSGISDGLNQLKGFVKSRRGTSNHNILGMDCEMIYTKGGMEVASVILVNIRGKIVYQALVRPQHEVIDYNTKFSGVSLDDFKKKHPKPFHDVQRELLRYIKSETIVIGHSLDNDLRVLKIVHPLVVDTTVVYPHQDGFPFRRSLKDLAQDVLGVPIQTKETGHDPVEDAKTAVALVLNKVKMDHEENDLK